MLFESTLLDKDINNGGSPDWRQPSKKNGTKRKPKRKCGHFSLTLRLMLLALLPTAFGRASVIRISPSVSASAERWFVCRSLVHMLQGGTEWHRHKRAHRPGHAHPVVVGVVLALTSVSRKRAALLGEEAAPATRRSRRRRLESRHRRRCVQERRDSHCEEGRRQSALEPISKQLPAAQRLLRKLAEALI